MKDAEKDLEDKNVVKKRDQLYRLIIRYFIRFGDIFQNILCFKKSHCQLRNVDRTVIVSYLCYIVHFNFTRLLLFCLLS